MVELATRIDPTELILTDKLIHVNRVAKVMKGGNASVLVPWW